MYRCRLYTWTYHTSYIHTLCTLLYIFFMVLILYKALELALSAFPIISYLTPMLVPFLDFGLLPIFCPKIQISQFSSILIYSYTTLSPLSSAVTLVVTSPLHSGIFYWSWLGTCLWVGRFYEKSACLITGFYLFLKEFLCNCLDSPQSLTLLQWKQLYTAVCAPVRYQNQ